MLFAELNTNLRIVKKEEEIGLSKVGWYWFFLGAYFMIPRIFLRRALVETLD